MRLRLRLVMMATLVVLTAIAVADDNARSQELESDKLGSTRNVHSFGMNLLCGQPSAEDFAEAKRRGIKVVITLRQEGEVDWDEPGTVRELGMDFHRLGFRGPDTLSDAIFEDSLRVLANSKTAPVLLHCGSANRVGAIWLAHRVLNDGLALDDARSEAKDVGLRTAGYEQKALAYIIRRKADGRLGQFPAFPPSDVTRTQDRDQMMAQLGVQFLQLPLKLEDPNRPKDAWPRDKSNPEGNWTDADGNTITRGGFGLWVTYDDDNAGDYTPIDLLKMKDGSRITTAKEWWNKRRPEVFKDVQEQVWGVLPDDSILPSVTWDVNTSNGAADGVAYTEKVITGIIDTSRYPELRNVPLISSTLRIPANASGPVPVIVFFGSARGMGRTWSHVAPRVGELARSIPTPCNPTTVPV